MQIYLDLVLFLCLTTVPIFYIALYISFDSFICGYEMVSTLYNTGTSACDCVQQDPVNTVTKSLLLLNDVVITSVSFLPEARFGVRVLSLPASVVCVCVCVMCL